MKKILVSIICVLSLMTISMESYAQKYGHVNLGNLLTEMPGINSGSEALEKYQTQQIEGLKVKVADWERRYKELSEKVNELPPNEVKEREQKLVDEQQKLLQEEQMITVKVNDKRKEIMGPILQKVQEVINEVGRENGYTMIFDSSIPNAFLFVEDSIDISQLVLSKLGINK